MNIKEVSPKDLFVTGIDLALFKNDVLVVKITGDKCSKLNYDVLPARICGFAAYLVKNGEMEIIIDRITYTVGPDEIVELFNNNIIEEIRFSCQFEGYYIMISEALYDAIESWTNLEPLYKISFNNIELTGSVSKKESQDLDIILQKIYRIILKNAHYFLANIVHAEVALFLLELRYVRLKKSKWRPSNSTSDNQTYKYIIMSFSKLLQAHCRKENSILFYASRLFVSPQQLSHITKISSGMSAKMWINKARLSEAKALLRNHKYTIQQISEKMNFSNLTGFCRFFRKHTNISPLEYRKKIIKEF